jgi:hypothetical protein
MKLFFQARNRVYAKEERVKNRWKIKGQARIHSAPADLALTRLVARVLFIDYIQAALAANHLAVAVPLFQRFQ